MSDYPRLASQKSNVYLTSMDMEQDDGNENDVAIQWDGSTLQLYKKESGTWGDAITITGLTVSKPSHRKSRNMKLKSGSFRKTGADASWV